MHLSSFMKMLDFRERYLKGKEDQPLRILDIGSQDFNGSYKRLFDTIPAWTYIGVDMAPGKNVDVALANSYYWREFPASSIDVLISGQALEHIEYFWLTMLEVTRVLRPGGLGCIIVPSAGPEHRYPVDCWRFLPDGLVAAAKFAKLEVIEVHAQRESEYYADGSDAWQDCRLVCRRPKLGWWSRVIQRAAQSMTLYTLASKG